MPMNILGMGLATPGDPIAQTDLLELANRFNTTNDAQRSKLKRIYQGTKVKQRFSVLSEIGDGIPAGIDRLCRFYDTTERDARPGTRRRMAVYEQQALPLALSACESALHDSGADPHSITQLITVSCTGFAAPGFDLGLIDALGLDPTVGRTHLGFMGCHGAINALRVADAFVGSDAGQRVLLCCTELCTLHFQYGPDPQDAVANAIFSDGAAALIGGAPGQLQTTPCTAGFFSTRLQATEAMMSWRIGDDGFRMRLDSRVPGVIQGELHDALRSWLKLHGRALTDIEGWIIHPGGPKVLDAVQSALHLPPQATQPSRQVLHDFGNMSSPTVLFILDALRRQDIPRPWVALAFGPGLIIEAALFQ